MKKLTSSRPVAGLAMVFAMALAACSETPMEPDDHAEPEGVHLIMGGNVIASYDGEDETWDGDLEVDEGEGTPPITVRFVDHEGDPIPIDDDLYLEVDIGDSSVAEFVLDTPGGFVGSLRGHMQGETGVTFKLMHGEVGSGHPDFVTEPVPVHVH